MQVLAAVWRNIRNASGLKMSQRAVSLASFRLLLGRWFIWDRKRLMEGPLPKSTFVLLALSLWILACPESLAEDDDPIVLNQQVLRLTEQWKFQEAIPIAEKSARSGKARSRS